MPTFGKTCLGLLAALAISSTAAGADIALPAPVTQGGEGIFTVLNARHSALPSDFSLKSITMQELSNLLWAATGQNRNGNGWTVPFAMHRAPYNTIYVLMDSGTYRYDWQKNRLEEISSHDVRRNAGPQRIVGESPVVLVFVGQDGTAREYADIAAGAMTQNIYLAAASLGIEGRFVITMNENALRQELKLKTEEYPVNLMLIGKK